jgi:hypothetical protein
MLRANLPATVIKMSVQRMVCTGCGSEANATCNCGLPYKPKAERAKEAIEANPGKSDRAIAKEIGVSHTAVQNARKATGKLLPVDEHVGLDGKTRRLPQRSEPEEEEAAEKEHQEGLRVIAARGFLNRAIEAKKICTIEKLQSSDVTNEMIQAAYDAATAWETSASQLEKEDHLGTSAANAEDDDDFESDSSDEIAPPEEIEDNVLYAINRINEHTRVFKKLLRISALDREAATRINTAISRMMGKWRSIQSTLEKKR